jgi:hypothetical protein
MSDSFTQANAFILDAKKNHNDLRKTKESVLDTVKLSRALLEEIARLEHSGITIDIATKIQPPDASANTSDLLNYVDRSLRVFAIFVSNATNTVAKRTEDYSLLVRKMELTSVSEEEETKNVTRQLLEVPTRGQKRPEPHRRSHRKRPDVPAKVKRTIFGFL